MLNVLLESRAPRARRVGSTVASAVLHGALIAAAVAVTMPGPADARGGGDPPRPIDYVRVPPEPPSGRHVAHREDGRIPTRGFALPTIAAPDLVPDQLPPIDVGPAIPPDEIVIGGHGVGERGGSPIVGGDPSLTSGLSGAAIEERLVDRAPRVLDRALEPRYPAALRDAGVEGRVVVQFVVDTVGRAELGALQVVGSPHAVFVESVRAVLARYRFSAGEVAGRKVRTRVEMRFDFTLTR
jgi:protein TonB